MKKAIALLTGNDGDGKGTVSFAQEKDGPTTVTGSLRSLKPGHRVLIVHAYGDITNPPVSFGPSFYTDGETTVDPDGTADFKFDASQLSLYEPDSAIGRAFVVHEKVDDLGTGPNPDGKTNENFGPAVAWGVIGLRG